MIQTVGLGPHRFNRAIRPAWFFDPKLAGGILADIASHKIEQFLFYTGSPTAEIVHSAIGKFGTEDFPEFEDFGEVVLRSDRACGYLRVDWFTPDGLPTWGDGRFTLLGTDGYHRAAQEHRHRGARRHPAPVHGEPCAARATSTAATSR